MLHRPIRLFFLASVVAALCLASAAFAATQLEIRQADIGFYTVPTDDATLGVYVKDSSLKVNPGVLIATYSSLVIRNVVLSGDFLVQATMPAGLTISLIGCTFTNADITGVSVGSQLSIATSRLNYINVANALGGALSVSDSTLTSLASSSGWYLLRLTGGMANGSSFSMARCNASLIGTGINGGPVDLGDVSGATVSMSANSFSSTGDVATTQRVGINIGAITGNSNVTIASHTIDVTMSSDIHCIHVGSWASTGSFTLTSLTCTAAAAEFYGQTTAGVTIRGADATGLVLLEDNTITATAFEAAATAVSFNPITALATTMTLRQVVMRSNVLVAESRDAAAVGVSVGLIPAVTVSAIDILYGSITATTTTGTANALLLPSNGGTGIALTLAQGTFSVTGDAGSATSAVMIAVPAVTGAPAWPNSPIVITGSTFLAGSTGAVMMQNVKLSLATSSIMARCSLWKGALLAASDLDAAAVINIATCGNVSTTALNSCEYRYDCNPVTTRRAVLKSGLCFCACRGDTSVMAWYPRTLQCPGSLGVGLVSRTMTEPMIPMEDLSGSRISVYAALLVATMLWMVVLCAFVIGSCLLCGFGVGCCKHFGARAVRHSGARRQYRPGTLQRRHKVIADARDVEAKALRDAGHEQDAVMLLAMPMPSAAQQTAGVAATFHSFERERTVSAFINEMGSALKLFFGCGSHAAICEDDMDSVHSGVTSDDPSIAGLEETGDADRPAGPAPLAPSVRQTLVLNWVQDQDLGPEIRGYAAVEGAGYTTARHVMSPEGRPVGRGEMFSPKPGTGTGGAVATTYGQDDIRSIVQTVLRDEDVRSVLGGFGGATRSVHSVDASFTSHAGGAGVSGAGGDANAERLRVQMRDLQKGTATSMAALQRLVKDMSEQQLRRFDELQHNIAMTANSPVARAGPGAVANTPASAAAAGLSDEQMQTLAKIVESTVQRALAAQRATSSASAASVPSPAQQRLAVVSSEPTDARAWTSRSGPNSSRVPATTTAAIAPTSSRSHPHEPFTYHARAAAHAGRAGGAGSSDSEDYEPVETTGPRSAAPFGDDDGAVGSIQPQSQRGTVGASAPASSLGAAPSAQPGASRLAIPLVATDPQQQHADGDTPRGPTSGRARGPVPMSQGSPFGNGARGRR